MDIIAPAPWVWGLMGCALGLAIERLVLRLPLSVLAPYQGQFMATDFQGPGGGLDLTPSLPRKALLAGLLGLSWLLVAVWQADGWIHMAAWTTCVTTLLILAFVDWNTTLLPDRLVLPLLWAGVLASERGWTHITVSESLWSITAWYAALSMVTWLYQHLRDQIGMADGDIKLLAAMSAWWGWQPLVWVLLISSILVLTFALTFKKKPLTKYTELPFGPFLVSGVLLWTIASEVLP